MRLSTLATSVLAVTPVMATRWVVSWEQTVGINCCARGTWWNDDLGKAYTVSNFNEGCHGATQVDGVKEFCIDWGHERGHFIRLTGEKICVHGVSTEVVSQTDYTATYRTIFSNTACTW
ncbi:hypothetical protein B0I35DRAFT_359700 [Stachybotrys elegans]|uniref:Uncharacterized protein n=1 Tax=Stachybotrys elegans TaxID=80388 RepID=A0A8K0WLK7_9HYPO|nr:hypothetical protein B0I35DRAFT_359700 [Stachybotrys elegans]